MFDTAASQIQIAMRAAVSCEALRDLKALLRGNPAQPGRGGVVENQHQSLQSSGDADGKAETSWVYSTPTIPIQVQVPAVAGPTSRNSTEHRENVGTAVAPTLRKSSRLQRQKGDTR